MKKIIFILHMLVCSISQATFSFEDIEKFYKNGEYDFARKTIRSSLYPPERNDQMINDARAYEAQIFLLAMGDFKDFGPANDQFKRNVQSKISTFLMQADNLQHTDMAWVVKALWIANKRLEEDDFPAKYADLFTGQRSVEQGISILKNLNSNKHAAYMLSKLYLRPEETRQRLRLIGNGYLKMAAQLGHSDAQNDFHKFGGLWEDEDQFCDHCKWWMLFPDCAGANTIGKKIKAWLGCGPSNEGNGWISCNCIACGFSTELNCTQIANYSTSGFRSFLGAIDHPLRLVTACTIGSATILQGTGYAAAFPLSIAATILSVLSIAVQKEIKDESPGVDNAAPSAASLHSVVINSPSAPLSPSNLGAISMDVPLLFPGAQSPNSQGSPGIRTSNA